MKEHSPRTPESSEEHRSHSPLSFGAFIVTMLFATSDFLMAGAWMLFVALATFLMAWLLHWY